jgi:hypothetical protein
MTENYEIKGESSVGRILYYPDRNEQKYVFQIKILDARGQEKYAVTNKQSDMYRIRESIVNKK